MLDIDSREEESLAKRFGGDPGVHVTATGRVVPRRCELCCALYVPEDPMAYWKGGVLPKRLRAPALAAEILAIWGGRLPKGLEASLVRGFVPVAPLAKPAEEFGKAIDAIRHQYGLEFERIERKHQEDQEATKGAAPAERPRLAASIRRAYEATVATTAEDRDREIGAKRAAAVESRRLLRYVLDHYGECWKHAGGRTAVAYTETFPELRNRRTEWCDAGELRGDVEPDRNRDMAPCLPPPADA